MKPQQNNMKKYCIYRHIRLDINKVFYIGIGSSTRSKSKTRRNKYWNNIVNKTDYEVQILKSDLLWEDACELEKILISFYGRKDNSTGILCNLTDGGEGAPGHKVCENTKAKISLKLKNIKKSEETKRNMSIAQKKVKKDINSKIFKKIINIENDEIFDSIKEAYLTTGKSRAAFTWKLINSKNFNFKYYE